MEQRAASNVTFIEPMSCEQAPFIRWRLANAGVCVYHEQARLDMKKSHLPLASAITLIAGLALLVGLGRIHGEQESAAASPASAHGPVHVLKITVLSTMLTDAVGVGEWGFSALVEVDGKRVLYETGGRPETVLNNARELGVDLSNVEDVILSHNHWDHVTGLVTLRREWPTRTRFAARMLPAVFSWSG